ncbi:ZIP family metal transporter [Candidatus Woesearchaeota archaeon]|nr:ZIP family metal transporter [Candidatus Woesearchaeota archaeon]
MYYMYPLISVIIVSLVSVVFAVPLLMKKKISNSVLVFLLSMSVGVLLTTVFMDFLPEAMAHGNAHEELHAGTGAEQGHDQLHSLTVAGFILLGFLLMFIIEKFVHYHHGKKCEHEGCGKGHLAHGHAYNVAPINLIGDGVHNFIDGLVIAGTYAVSPIVGIAATISIIFHEIPQEIADFGILLYSGMSKKKALLFNFMSAATAIIGTVVGIVIVGRITGFTEFMIPFAAGNFIYIAASNLVPQLHRQCGLKDTLLHVFAIVLGIAIIAAITVYGPAHVHF